MSSKKENNLHNETMNPSFQKWKKEITLKSYVIYHMNACARI